MPTLGCVEYVNAKPLIAAFANSSGIQVRLDVPSKLPQLLNSGEADVVLASSFELFREEGLRFAAGASISTLGAAESVRLFSKVPFEQIRSLALDQSSLTSNHLALILLREMYEINPAATPQPPDLGKMLETDDACLLIGDKGMEADGEGLHVLDLGQAWRDFTGHPFVWAVWMGRDGLTPELAAQLLKAREWGEAHLDEVIEHTLPHCGWPRAQCERYLRETMCYRLDAPLLAGLREYHRLLLKHGFATVREFPEQVAGACLQTSE